MDAEVLILFAETINGVVFASCVAINILSIIDKNQIKC